MSAYSNISGLFKRRYAPFVNPLPSDRTLAKEMKFVPAELRPGEDYRFPLQSGLEGGVTHDTSETAFTLNSVVDSTVQVANLDGASILVAGNIPYDVIAKAMNGDGSYMTMVDYKVKALMQAGELYRELALAYGGGTGAAVSASIATVSTSVSGANLGAGQVLDMTRATWSAGIWNNMVGQLVDILQSDGDTSRETDVTVDAVAHTNNRVNMSKAASAAVVATGDLIIARGSEDSTCYGVKAILQNTGSLFGINAGTYPFWQAETYSAGSASLTIQMLQNIGARLSRNGLDKGGKVFVAPETFADLVTELQDHDRYVNPSGDAKQSGLYTMTIKSACGPLEVICYKWQQQGFAWVIGNGTGKRVGSTDLTFSLPGTNNRFHVELESTAGVQFRIFTNQAPILTVPYHCAIITNIQNNGDTTPSA
ncbi:MAG: hypothetical protein VW405_02790 [Rhodospirillaceae bacterium]